MTEHYTCVDGRIEEILREHGVYASVVCGVSMRPMLRQGRDIVYIMPLGDSVKKYDVLLYRLNGRYILHRVIGFYPEGYVIRGDNTYKKEYIPKDDVVGILTKYYKKGKERSAKNRLFFFYGMLVQVFYIPRFLFVRLRARLIGLLKRLKKEN